MPRTRSSASRSKPTSTSSSSRGRLGRDSTPDPVRIARANGSALYDESGKRYIDLTSGWCVGNLGWGRGEILDAIRDFRGPDYVCPHFEYAPWDELAAELCAVAPGRMQRAFRATGGSEAVDLALQAAMVATERTKFVTLKDSYHGNTLAGMAISGEGPDGALRESKQIKPPLDEDALSRVETALKSKDVAAFVMEPIPINLGVEVPEPEFMRGLEELCEQHGTLLIADEVATGFGRTGRMFAAEHYDLQPDIVCMAKGITAGYAPMGAMLTTKQVADDIEDGFSGYSTYGWHPIAVEAARANLAYWKKRGREILENVEERGEQIRGRLDAMELGEDVDVRAKGLAIGVHLEDDKVAQRIADKARKAGVLVAASAEVLQIMPPLTITAREVEEAMDALESCV